MQTSTIGRSTEDLSRRLLLSLGRVDAGDRNGDIWIAQVGPGDRRGGRSDSSESECRGRVDAPVAAGTPA